MAKRLILVLLLAGSFQVMCADKSGSEAVAEVLALQERMQAAAQRGDAAFMERSISDRFVASDPSNKIRHKEDLVRLFASGGVVYTNFSTEVDFAEELADGLVVVMGTETSEQSAVPADSGLEDVAIGKVLKRRYTNVYIREQGSWRLLVKQSTITGIE